MRFPTYDFARSPSVWSFGGLWSEVPAVASHTSMVLAKEENSINTCFKLHFYVILSFPFEMGNNKKYGESFFCCCGYIFESRGWFKQYRHVCIWLDAGKLWKKNVQKTSSIYSFVVVWAYCNAMLQVPSAERYFFIAFRNFIKIDYEKHLFY